MTQAKAPSPPPPQHDSPCAPKPCGLWACLSIGFQSHGNSVTVSKPASRLYPRQFPLLLKKTRKGFYIPHHVSRLTLCFLAQFTEITPKILYLLQSCKARGVCNDITISESGNRFSVNKEYDVFGIPPPLTEV